MVPVSCVGRKGESASGRARRLFPALRVSLRFAAQGIRPMALGIGALDWSGDERCTRACAVGVGAVPASPERWIGNSGLAAMAAEDRIGDCVHLRTSILETVGQQAQRKSVSVISASVNLTLMCVRSSNLIQGES